MFVENIFEYIKKQLENGIKPALYIKTASIKARKGIIGEKIVTIMSDGHIESQNIVKNDGDMVVTNPNGEQFLMRAKDFAERYMPIPEKPEHYYPKPLPQTMLYLDKDIEFVAPWGEVMSIRAGGYLNITKLDEGYVYGIQPREFKQTYKPYNK